MRILPFADSTLLVVAMAIGFNVIQAGSGAAQDDPFRIDDLRDPFGSANPLSELKVESGASAQFEWTIARDLFDQNDQFIRTLFEPGSTQPSQVGMDQIDATLEHNRSGLDIARYKSQMSFQPQSGIVTAMTDFRIRPNSQTLPRHQFWDEYKGTAVSYFNIQDEILVGDAPFGFVEAKITFDGIRNHDSRVDMPGIAEVNTESYAAARVGIRDDSIDTSGGGSSLVNQIGLTRTMRTELIPFQNTADSDDDSVMVSVSQISGPEDDGIITIDMMYVDLMQIEFGVIDARWAEGIITHDFTSTANLELNFYDDNMNLIPDFEYTSALGVGYQSAAAVPEPGTFASLAMTGLCGWIGHRRRRRFNATTASKSHSAMEKSQP